MNAEYLEQRYDHLIISPSFKHYTEAIQGLLKGETLLADAILVDLEYSDKHSPSLAQIIKGTNLRAVPILYAMEHFNQDEVSALVRRGTLDEVVEIADLPADFGSWLALLKKAKRYSNRVVRVSRPKEPVANGLIPSISPKRWMDIAMSSLFILCLSPVFLLVALAIRLESRGPVIYRSRRAGMGYKVFTFFKFRTMRVGADQMVSMLADKNQYGGQGAAFFKIKDDPRVTRVGAWLRKTSLDELPQLFNVLFGDMSIVGNRPLPLYEAEQLTTDDWAERFMGPAGITGLWQVEKRGKPHMRADERIEMDIEYARHHNIWLDFQIIAKTPFCLVQKVKV
jgi:lipopolysaccharide/colanic/teichoic acid biosynthesis glycosyltransferase